MTRMMHPPQSSRAATGDQEVVLGVDTHKDTHVAAVLDPVGALLGSRCFATTAAGYQQLLCWAQALGRVRRAGVECTGSYGAALTRHLLAAGAAGRRGQSARQSHAAPTRQDRRGRRRSRHPSGALWSRDRHRQDRRRTGGDGPDVQAGQGLRGQVPHPGHQPAQGRAGGRRPSATRVVVGATHDQAHPPMRCTGHRSATDATSAAAWTLRLLAHRIVALTAEVGQLRARITNAVNMSTPTLLERNGVGLDTAASLLITAGGNPQRLSSDAAFAALCGASPVEASSGKTQRHRLNQGGDRQANAALYRIALSRLRWDPRTQDYMTRRLKQGKSKREVIRCLKRSIAREIYQIMTQSPAAPTTIPSAA
jgi:transposase